MQLSFGMSVNYIFDPFYLPGEQISLYLLCCGLFAVKYHSFTIRASHLLQSQLVNSPGTR